jgi:hypothetical protein
MTPKIERNTIFPSVSKENWHEMEYKLKEKFSNFSDNDLDTPGGKMKMRFLKELF